MIDKPNRNHWISIVENVIQFIKSLLFIIIILFVKKNGIYYIGAMGILIVIMSVLEWRKTIFYINEDLLVFEKGVISKSKEEIPFNKINTIDIGQTIVDRIFKICTVKIDSGSAVAHKSDFKIRVGYDLAHELRKVILDSKEEACIENEDETVTYTVQKTITTGEILKYALTKGKLGWALGGYFVIDRFFDDIGRFFDISISKLIDKYMSVDLIKAKSISTSMIIILGVGILAYIFITILSIIVETIRLYGFTVKSDNEKISISYGLLSKKEYSFNIDKIYGIRYKQSIVQQFINTYTVELITIGYGDEKNEKALLYPIANDNFKNEFINKLLPNMIFDGEIKAPPKSSLRRFILRKAIVVLIMLIVAIIFIKVIPNRTKGALSIMALLIVVLMGYLEYKNTSLGISKKAIIASKGRFLKVTTVIGQDTLQSITKKQGVFQKWGKVCNYKIDIYSNKMGDIVEVRNMDESLYEKLQDNLIL